MYSVWLSVSSGDDDDGEVISNGKYCRGEVPVAMYIVSVNNWIYILDYNLMLHLVIKRQIPAL